MDSEIFFSYLVALSLQEEQKAQSESSKEWEQYKHESGMEGLTDEELAKRLQEEENSRYSQKQLQEQQQQQQQLVHQQSNQLINQHQRMYNSQSTNDENYAPQNSLHRRTPNSPGDSDNNGSKSKSKNVSA